MAAIARPSQPGSSKVGDKLVSHDGDSVEVTKIGSVERQGFYSPLTEDGTLVVNGYVASNYVAFGEAG